MANLIYLINTSLDGYIEGPDGRFDWSEPDDAVHGFINDLQRPVGTYLLGRRMYEVMAVWDSDDMFEGAFADQSVEVAPVHREFADIWRAAEKVVYSRTLDAVSTGRTRLERDFDPEAVRAAKASATADLAIAGPELAAVALRAGLVDEIQLVVAPVVLGGGKRALPEGLRIDLELNDEHRFEGGTVYLSYRRS